MGGFYPTDKGENEGHLNGLVSDLSLVECMSKIDKTKFDAYYWVGFDIGYAKGQAVRNDLKVSKSEFSLEQKIECYRYFYQKNGIRNTGFQDYLETIQYWHNFKIDPQTTKKALDFLDKKKIQRCVDCISSFYSSNFRLKSLMDFDSIDQSLKELRLKKRMERSYNISEELKEIELQLRSWIAKNQEL